MDQGSGRWSISRAPQPHHNHKMINIQQCFSSLWSSHWQQNCCTSPVGLFTYINLDLKKKLFMTMYLSNDNRWIKSWREPEYTEKATKKVHNQTKEWTNEGRVLVGRKRAWSVWTFNGSNISSGCPVWGFITGLWCHFSKQRLGLTMQGLLLGRQGVSLGKKVIHLPSLGFVWLSRCFSLAETLSVRSGTLSGSTGGFNWLDRTTSVWPTVLQGKWRLSLGKQGLHPSSLGLYLVNELLFLLSIGGAGLLLGK